MRKLKRFLIGVCTAALCLSAIVTPVAAKSSSIYDKSGAYEYVLPSYTQTAKRVKNWTEFNGQMSALIEQCKVQNPASWYVDTGIKEAAAKYLKEGKYVGDLRYLTDNGIFSLNASNSKAFNYGIFITDDINTGRYTIICKCSQSDFNEMASTYYGSSNKTEFTFYDVEGHTDYSYDKVNHILTVKNYPY
ncbi:MAG: hypothetical protein J5684_05625 [Eubacterium sp.]|nr:hypothetical protein [Eubacterium sp.]